MCKYIDENRKLLRIIKEKNQDIEEILIKLEIQNKAIESVKSTNLKLEEQIDNLKNIIESEKYKIHLINIERISDEENHYRVVNEYENKIRELMEQNEELFMNINFKISSLLSLIDEKDIIIQNFMK